MCRLFALHAGSEDVEAERYADTGGVSLQNTHPFLQDGRVFAHNGVVGSR